MKRKAVLNTSDLVTVVIPLNSYSFIDSLKEKLLPNMRFEVEVELEKDNNIVWEAKDTLRYVIYKFQLWVPKITFTPLGESAYTQHYLAPSTWNYLQERIDRSSSRREQSGTFDISSGLPRPRHVFVWFINDASLNDPKHNIFLYNTFNVANDKKIETAKLEVSNGNFYPDQHYTPSTDMSRVYHDITCYNYACFDQSVGIQLTRENFKNLFGMFYFDLRYQPDDLKDNTSRLRFT